MKKKVFCIVLSLFAMYLNAQDLSATFDVVGVSCNGLGEIRINATGGNGNYVYAAVPEDMIPNTADFKSNSSLSVSVGSYNVYVRDNSGEAGYTEIVEIVYVNETLDPIITSVVTQPICFEGKGSISVTIQDGLGPYNVNIIDAITLDIVDNQLTESTINFNNLSPGTYTIEVSDANTCSGNSETVTISEALPVESSVSSTDYTCFGTGTITFTLATGGQPPYHYGINGVYSTDLVFSNLTEGTYSPSVRDANGCEVMLSDIVIQGLPVEPAFTTNIDYNCNGSGNVTIMPSDPAYSYALDGVIFQASNVFADLNTGIHTISIDYGSGCISEQTVIVEDGNGLDGSVTNITNVSCNGSNDGSFTINSINSFNGFDYSLDGGVTWVNTSTSSVVVSGLLPQTYDVFIRETDNSNCIVSLGLLEIDELPALEITVVTTKVITCDSDEGASITANASGGSGGYEYSINGIDFQPDSAFTGLSEGTYSLSVRDTNGCEVISVDIVIEPLPVEPVFTTNIDYNCNGSGNVTIMPSDPAYSYVLDGVTFQASNVFTNLNTGNHTISIDYGSGCISEQTVTVEDGNGLDGSVTNITNVSCNGSNGGSFTINSVNSFNGFDYSLDGGVTWFNTSTSSVIVSELLPQTYDVFIRETDNSNCIVSLGLLEINELPALEITVIITKEITCDPYVGASIIANATGGSGGYEYSINGIDFQPDSMFTDLLEGTYNLSVRDTNGCESEMVTVVIEAVSEFHSVEVTMIKAAECTSGETIEVKYSSSDTVEADVSIISETRGVIETTRSIEKSVIFSDLMQDTYIIEIINPMTNCVWTASYVVAPVPEYILEVSKESNMLCYGDNSGAFMFNFSDITPYEGAFSYEVFTSAGASIETNTVSDSRFVTIEGLSADTYYVDVSMNDSPFCIVRSPEITIESPSAISATATLTAVSCHGGSDGTITVEASGGWGGYEYQLEDVSGVPISSYSNNAVFTGLEAGDYRVEVMDIEGCYLTQLITLHEPVPITFDLSGTNACNDSSEGEIRVNASGGTGSYTYKLFNSLGALLSTQNTNIFTGLIPDNYRVEVEDSHNCQEALTSSIRIYEGLDFSLEIVKPVDCSLTPEAEIALSVWSGSGSSRCEVVDANGTVIASSSINSINEDNPDFIVFLEDGIYQFNVYDLESNCTLTKEIEVSPLVQPEFTASIIDDSSCDGRGSGVIELRAIDEDLPVTYMLNPLFGSFNQETNSFVDLPSGEYTITATGTNGCEMALTVTINRTDALTANVFVEAPNTIEIVTSGGTPPYLYSIDNGTTYQQDAVFSNLDAGNYDVTIQDANGCQITYEFVSINPFIPSAEDDYVTTYKNVAVVINLFENDESIIPDGANLVVTNPASGSIALDDNNTPDDLFDDSIIYTPNGNFSGEDTFTYTISNDYGEDSATVIVDVEDTGDLTLDVVVNNISCHGEDDGRLEIIVEGGLEPYYYEIINDDGFVSSSTTNIFNNLNRGEYSIYVTDNLNNELVYQNILIEEPELIVINAVTVTGCGRRPSGKIVVGATGGTGNYMFSIDGSNFRSSNVFFDLSAGTYEVLVKDSNDCLSLPFTVTIEQIDVDNSVSVDKDKCNANFKGAVSYQWINADTNERIKDATNSTFSPSKSGRYQVEMVIEDASTRLSKGVVVMKTTQVVLSPVIEFVVETLSNEDIDKAIFSVYPNPVNNYLIVPSKVINNSYQIYNLLGQNIKQGNLTVRKLPLEALSKGVYLLTVEGYKPVRFVKK